MVALELRVAQYRHSAARRFQGILDRWPTKLQPRHFLWACAFMPIFVLPPLVSLAASVAHLRRRDRLQDEELSFEWIGLISALNVILSIYFLYKFHFSPTEIAAFLGGAIRALFKMLFNLVPLQQTPSARVIPA